MLGVGSESASRDRFEPSRGVVDQVVADRERALAESARQALRGDRQMGTQAQVPPLIRPRLFEPPPGESCLSPCRRRRP